MQGRYRRGRWDGSARWEEANDVNRSLCLDDSSKQLLLASCWLLDTNFGTLTQIGPTGTKSIVCMFKCHEDIRGVLAAKENPWLSGPDSVPESGLRRMRRSSHFRLSYSGPMAQSSGLKVIEPRLSKAEPKPGLSGRAGPAHH